MPKSIHQAFDALFEMDLDTIRNLPNLYFVRTAYAAVGLIKMDGVLRCKGSRMCDIFDLKVESYLQKTIDLLSRASEGGQSPPAFGFGFVFQRLKSWQATRQDRPFGVDARCAAEPTKRRNESLDEAIQGAQDDVFQAYSRSEIAPAAWDPTTVYQDETWAAQHLSLPLQNEYVHNDTTMFNLGLPQFYDFGFTFDDSGLMQELQGQNGTDAGWVSWHSSWRQMLMTDSLLVSLFCTALAREPPIIY